MSSCSTRSPLELRILSPRGTTIGDGGGGGGGGGRVGLGIVAALEKCGAVGGSVAVKSVLKPCSTHQADFLSLCHLCRKMLQGRDIYMYRGEKAFCSDECRCRQIIMDERKEKCISETSTCGEVSSSKGKLFFTEIVASS